MTALSYRGRHNDNEMHEFIDECFLEVLSQLVNKDKSLSHRICSLYLLYALYVKEPLDQSMKTRFDVKVRITLDQLKIVREFIEHCKVNQFLDACFVWYKLVAIGLHFVYYRYSSLGPSNTRSVNYYMFQNGSSTTDKLIVDLKKSLEPRLQTLSTYHESYIEFKDKMFDGENSSHEKKPNIISTETHRDSSYQLNKLVTDFKYMKGKLRGRGRPAVWAPYTADGEEEIESPENMSKIRAEVQKKAIKSKVKSEKETWSNILWNNDIIDSIKRGKLKKEMKKSSKTGTTVKTEEISETESEIKDKPNIKNGRDDSKSKTERKRKPKTTKDMTKGVTSAKKAGIPKTKLRKPKH